ncbi:MAG: hypothetical protein IJB69_01485 [Clostridia bacterium]|nr:hypothetical protein [Clostridia bacterium]
MKKSTLIMILSLVLAVAIGVGSTMAYLQDTDEDVNVMTLGNVYIEQHEYERVQNEDGTYEMVNSEKYGEGYKLQEFTQGKPLYPAVGEVTDYGEIVAFDQLGEGASGSQAVLDGIQNAQDKFVLVENTGKSDAYVRTIFAFEMGTMEESRWEEILKTSVGSFTNNGDKPWKYTDIGTAVIDGNTYFLMEAVYTGADTRHVDGVLPAGEYTYCSLAQVYLKPEANNEDMVALDGNGNGTFDILVVSQAVQTQGFADAKTALDTAFGPITVDNNPWKEGGEDLNGTPAFPVMVSTADELVAAIANGGEYYLTADLTLADEPVVIASGKEVTINMNGNTISTSSTSSTTSYGIEVQAGATLELKGEGLVTFYATKPDTEWGGEGQPAFPGYANNTIKNLGKLIIDGPTVENKTAAGGASYCIDCYQGSELIIESGEIKGYDKCAIRMFANSNTLATSVTVNGGEISGKRGIWIQLPGSNPANVRPVYLTVTGGTITSLQPDVDNAIYSYSYGDSFANTNVTITGGTFNGNVAFGGGYKGDTENVTITGGTFNGYLGRYLADDGWEDIAKP